MKRREFLKSATIASASFAQLRFMQASEGADDKPNIVFILADDLGYGDVHSFNRKSRIPTPNLDRLAGEGIVFTDAHSGSAVCTPTRYGVLTGRYAWRTRMKRGVLNGYSSHLIDPARMTVASLLKKNGYHTACIGKWHLGMDFPWLNSDKKTIDVTKPIENGPNVYGFDYFFGVSASLDFPPYGYVENNRFTEPLDRRQKKLSFPIYLRDGAMGTNFKHVETLDALLGKAKDYISQNAKKDAPFFLYFPMTAPHKPVMPAKRFEDTTELGPYGDFVHQVDWTVGQVMETLEKSGAADNTLLIVTSDNGSFMNKLEEDATGHVTDPAVQGFRPSSHRSAHIFRGTKADIWEGGHRIPFIARWPGKTQPGTTCDRTICLTDFMATCASVVGESLPENAGEDSFTLVPSLLGETNAPRRPAVVHHSANGTFAVREGNWKLVLSSGSGGREKPKGKPGQKPFCLFDMKSDPSERNDVSTQFPIHVKRLEALLQKFIDEGHSVKK